MPAEPDDVEVVVGARNDARACAAVGGGRGGRQVTRVARAREAAIGVGDEDVPLGPVVQEAEPPVRRIGVRDEEPGDPVERHGMHAEKTLPPASPLVGSPGRFQSKATVKAPVPASPPPSGAT